MKIIQFPKERLTKPRWYLKYKNINKKRWLKLVWHSLPVLLALALVGFILFKLNHGI